MQACRQLGVLLAAAALLLAAAPRRASAVKPISDWVEGGLATHFGGAQDGMDPSSPSFGTKYGSCGYGAISKKRFPFFSTAALAPSNRFYTADALHGCGQCFQVQCADGRDGVCKRDGAGTPLSVLVMISDSCPECGADHLDVQSLAFAKLADPGVGRIGMRYRRVECAPPDDLKVSVMDYRGAGSWLRLAIDNAGGRAAVASVAVKGGGGDWQPLHNSWGATWEAASAPQPPLSFRITDDGGEEVEAHDVVKQAGGIGGGADGPRATFAAGVQFAITDPAWGKGGGQLKVTAFEGPSSQSDPMVVDSSTPGADGAPASSTSASASGSGPSTTPGSEDGSSANGGCREVPTPDGYSCQQQKDWGKCGQDFIQTNGYCKCTCGGGGSGGGSNNDNGGQQQQQQAGGNRRMLRQRR